MLGAFLVGNFLVRNFLGYPSSYVTDSRTGVHMQLTLPEWHVLGFALEKDHSAFEKKNK